MDFYPPLNLDAVFDKTINEKAIAKFGFVYPAGSKAPPKPDKNKLSNVLPKSKTHHNFNKTLRATIKLTNNNPLNNNGNRNNNNNINQSANQLNKVPKQSLPPAPALTVLKEKIQLPNNPNHLIRKLGQNERIFHGYSDTNRSYIYRTAIVTSDIDFYKHLNIVQKALSDWKALHPLLRCRVVTKVAEPDVKEKYFAFATEKKIKDLDNVKFLYYNSNSTKTCDDIWKLLVERETTLPLDGENGLLWRLTFLQIRNIPKSDPSHGSFLYALLLTFDHSIMDGRSSYYSLLQLMSMIEDLYNTNYKKPKENPFLPSKEDIYKDRKPSSDTLNIQRYYIKAPNFMDLDNSIKSSYIRLKYLSQEEEKFGMIYSHDHKPFISVKELIDISKNNNSKFRTLVINKPDLTKILKKCKDNGVKLTTFLNMALIVALRNIHDKYERSPEAKNPVINYTTNISLREFPEFKINNPSKNHTIGCYIGLSFSSFKDPLKITNNSNWMNEFWRLSKKESDDFHSKLNRGDYIHSIHLPSKKKERDEFFYHFGNSNLGVLPSSLDGRKLIRIRQTFATGKYSKENFLCWFSNLIATIDNQLCWTLSFNTYSMKQELVNEIIENLTKVVKEIIR